MIRKDNLDSNLVRTYSDKSVWIQNTTTGVYYIDAVDLKDKIPTYIETKTRITEEPDYEQNY